MHTDPPGMRSGVRDAAGFDAQSDTMHTDPPGMRWAFALPGEVLVDRGVPAEAMAGRPHLWGTIEARDERTCAYRPSDDSLEWLALRIGMLGVDFEVHEPPELVAAIRTLGARFKRAATAPPA